LEQTIWKTLDQIRERDGAKIFEEVADRLIESIIVDVEIAKGKRHDLWEAMQGHRENSGCDERPHAVSGSRIASNAPRATPGAARAR
jgi:hypothetical protein